MSISDNDWPWLLDHGVRNCLAGVLVCIAVLALLLILALRAMGG